MLNPAIIAVGGYLGGALSMAVDGYLSEGSTPPEPTRIGGGGVFIYDEHSKRLPNPFPMGVPLFSAQQAVEAPGEEVEEKSLENKESIASDYRPDAELVLNFANNRIDTLYAGVNRALDSAELRLLQQQMAEQDEEEAFALILLATLH